MISRLFGASRSQQGVLIMSCWSWPAALRAGVFPALGVGVSCQSRVVEVGKAAQGVILWFRRAFYIRYLK